MQGTTYKKNLVEIKCPYSLRENHPKDVALQKQCFLIKLNNRWEVGKNVLTLHKFKGNLVYPILMNVTWLYTQKRGFTYQLSGLMKNTF